MIPLATGIAVLWSYTGGRVRKLLAKSRILCFTLSFRNHSNRSRQSFSPLIVGKGNSYTRSETEQRFSSRAGGPCYETTTETLFQYWKARKVRKDGKVICVRETARAVLLNNRPVILVACEDITEHKHAEEALQKTQTELAHVTRVTTLGELTASIAHEVNQPIA